MDSDDNSTSEDTRKKRSGENLREIVKRSRNVSGTPQKANQEKDGKIDKLTEMMKELMVDIKEIKQNQNEYNQELTKLRKENGEIREENRIIKEKLNEMEKRLIHVEREEIKNNIIITGLEIKEKKGGLKQGLESFLEKAIGVKTQIRGAKELGPKVYKVELDSTCDREEIMENKSKLRQHSNIIYINREMTREEMKIQKEIKQIARNEREKGKIVKTGYQKITINGKELRWDKTRGELAEIKAKVNEKKTDGG